MAHGDEARRRLIAQRDAARADSDVERAAFWDEMISAFSRPVPCYDTTQTAYRFQRWLPSGRD